MSKTIINGIDVSECAYFNSVTYEEPYCNIDQEHLYTCSSDENCYFKQLKRLQGENEELREEIYATRNNRLKMYESFETVCNNFKQALEEIRKYCEEQNLKADYTACEILTIIDEVLYEN